MKRFLFLLVIFLVFPYSFAASQALESQDLVSSGIEFVLYPQTASPNSNVQAVLESTSVNLDTSNIAWLLNGKNIKSGLGIKEINFTTGPVGSQTTLEAIISNSGNNISKKITIASSDIDILWRGKGFIPPFYKGRTLWGAQTSITLMALPHVFNSNGKEISNNNLIYKWIKDGFVLGNVSGVGKNSLSLSDSVLSMPINIEVQVSIDGNSVVATKNLSFIPKKQSILIYENNPLYGLLFNKEINGLFSTTEKEFSFAAFPLFFSTTKKDSGNITYAWLLNGINSGSQSIITYRAPDNSPVSSNITLNVVSPLMVLQNVSRNFVAQFINEQKI